MDLDARPFRAFLAIAETRSFTRAAAMLNMSQPALSALIREFERRLGFPLFQRSSRRVELSTEGNLFIDRARRLVTETDWAINAAREIRTNQLRIGTAHFTGLIPERNDLIDGFIMSAPDVPLRVLRRSPVQLGDDLMNGAIDCAILLDIADDDPGAPVRPAEPERWIIGRRQVRLWVPAGHPLAAHATLVPAMLAGVDIGMLDRSHGVRIAERVGHALSQSGATISTMPESDADALARICRRMGKCAPDLGWFPRIDGMVSVPVAGWDVSVALVVDATRDGRREGADRFLAMLGAFIPA